MRLPRIVFTNTCCISGTPSVFSTFDVNHQMGHLSPLKVPQKYKCDQIHSIFKHRQGTTVFVSAAAAGMIELLETRCGYPLTACTGGYSRGSWNGFIQQALSCELLFSSSKNVAGHGAVPSEFLCTVTEGSKVLH